MVAVKVAYKYMVDFGEPDMMLSQLELSAFAAIDQKKPLMCT
jgi:hypothetical protein